MSSTLPVSVPIRPPTPPREKQRRHSNLRPPLGPLDARLNHVHTPPGIFSPGSSINTGSDSGSACARKRVGFSGRAEYQDPPVYSDDGVCTRSTPVSLPSSTSKPKKSILKPTSHVPLVRDEAAAMAGLDSSSAVKVDMAGMLDSTVQTLAGGGREMKLDAYRMLAKNLESSDNLPDRVALGEKMGLFTQFMQRDISARTADGAVDKSPVIHALTLLVTFLHFPAIAATIGNDFAVFIVEHSIRSFEDASLPKDVARHLMHVVATQNFPPRVISADRVARLVASLHNMPDHLQGKSIIMGRMRIYRRLVGQAKQYMAVHTDWLPDLFTDMLSTIKEIRSAAISLGLDAAFSIGRERRVSMRIKEIFNQVVDEQKYFEFYHQRLAQMTPDTETSPSVPKIWSVVNLFLGSSLRGWDYLQTWLKNENTCFNSPDVQTKTEAHLAWGRLAYTFHFDERLFADKLSLLGRPFIHLLHSLRRRTDRGADDVRNIVMDAVCALFYYAFRPTMKPEFRDGSWRNGLLPIIAPLVRPQAETSSENLDRVVALLSGLFDCTTPRPWLDDRIAKALPVQPKELPPIDPVWIRRNATTVFAVVEPILKRRFLSLANDQTESYKLWKGLVGAVATAASKEIKVSADTAGFVMKALDVLGGIWKEGVRHEEGAPDQACEFLLATRAFLDVIASSLSLLALTEKPAKVKGLVKAPMFQLFSILTSLPPGIEDGRAFSDFLEAVFTPFFSKSSKVNVNLARDLLSTIPMDTQLPYGPWMLAARETASWLEQSQDSAPSTGSSVGIPAGSEYRDVVKILERGLRSTPGLPWEHWRCLFDSAVEAVKADAGDPGVAIVVLEPLARVVVDQFALRNAPNLPPHAVKCVTTLLSTARQPRDRQAVDAARRRLWGTDLGGSRPASIDVFDDLLKAFNLISTHLYDLFSLEMLPQTIELLEQAEEFLARCSDPLFFKMQDGFLCWIQDANRHLEGRGSAALIRQVVIGRVLDRVAKVFGSIQQPEQSLAVFEPLFCAGFDSTHRSYVNVCVSLWNRLFEHVDHIDYPERLKSALLRLRPHVEVILPGLHVSSQAEDGQQQLAFVDSQNQDSNLLQGISRTPPSKRKVTPRKNLSARSSSSGCRPASIPAKRRLDKATAPALKVPRRSTPRIRHDDSQVEFVAVAPVVPSLPQDESQFLTDRQKEVRERQKETASLFPEIRSSSPVRARGAATAAAAPPTDNSAARPPRSSSGQASAQREATPEADGEYREYLSSTPTPRRGHFLALPEPDPADPPSSPPSPRRNPLAAEILSRSASQSLMDDWYCSSPVSGSPIPAGHASRPEPQLTHEDMPLPALDEEVIVHSADELESSDAEAGLPVANYIDKDMVEDGRLARAAPPPTYIIDPLLSSSPIKKSAVRPTLLTPSMTSRAPHAVREEPSSDHDDFVDAPSSPIRSSPKRLTRAAAAKRSVEKEPPVVAAAAAATATATATAAVPIISSITSSSFDLVEDPSFIKLVAQLDSKNVDPASSLKPSVPASPEKDKRRAANNITADAPALRSNADSSNLPQPLWKPASSRMSSRRSPRRSGMASAVTIPSTAPAPRQTPEQQEQGKQGEETGPTTIGDSQQAGSGPPGSRQKRKRGSSKTPAEVPDESSRKRRSQRLGNREADVEADVSAGAEDGIRLRSSRRLPSRRDSSRVSMISAAATAKDAPVDDDDDADGKDDDNDDDDELVIPSSSPELSSQGSHVDGDQEDQDLTPRPSRQRQLPPMTREEDEQSQIEQQLHSQGTNTTGSTGGDGDDDNDDADELMLDGHDVITTPRPPSGKKRASPSASFSRPAAATSAAAAARVIAESPEPELFERSSTRRSAEEHHMTDRIMAVLRGEMDASELLPPLPSPPPQPAPAAAVGGAEGTDGADGEAGQTTAPQHRQRRRKQQLSREEVYKIEDVLMGIKRQMYKIEDVLMESKRALFEGEA